MTQQTELNEDPFDDEDYFRRQLEQAYREAEEYAMSRNRSSDLEYNQFRFTSRLFAQCVVFFFGLFIILMIVAAARQNAN